MLSQCKLRSHCYPTEKQKELAPWEKANPEQEIQRNLDEERFLRKSQQTGDLLISMPMDPSPHLKVVHRK